jgi:hypothetical protein
MAGNSRRQYWLPGASGGRKAARSAPRPARYGERVCLRAAAGTARGAPAGRGGRCRRSAGQHDQAGLRALGVLRGIVAAAA